MSNELDFSETEKEEGVDIIELLKSGVPSVIIDQETRQVEIYVSPDDSEEVKNAKDNIQFVVDTAREAASFLLQLGKQTGNPRFFETVNSLLNTINGASGQLIGINNRKREPDKKDDKTQPTVGVINNDNRTIVMSTSDALREARNSNVKVIEG